MQSVKSRTVANHWARFEKQAAKNDKKTTGVGTDAFHQKVLFDFSEDTCQKVADFLLMVEVIGKCQQQQVVSCSFCCQRRFTVPGVSHPVVGMGPSRHHERYCVFQRKKQQEQNTRCGRLCWIWEPYKVESGPKDPGAVTVLIHRLARISKSTVDSGVELGSVLHKFPVFLRRMLPGISRTKEELFSKAAQQRQCKHTHPFCQKASSV